MKAESVIHMDPIKEFENRVRVKEISTYVGLSETNLCLMWPKNSDFGIILRKVKDGYYEEYIISVHGQDLKETYFIKHNGEIVAEESGFGSFWKNGQDGDIEVYIVSNSEGIELEKCSLKLMLPEEPVIDAYIWKATIVPKEASDGNPQQGESEIKQDDNLQTNEKCEESSYDEKQENNITKPNEKPGEILWDDRLASCCRIALRRITSLEAPVLENIFRVLNDIRYLIVRASATDGFEAEYRMIPGRNSVSESIVPEVDIIPNGWEMFNVFEGLVDDHHAFTQVYLVMPADTPGTEEKFDETEYLSLGEPIDIPDGCKIFTPNLDIGERILCRLSPRRPHGPLLSTGWI